MGKLYPCIEVDLNKIEHNTKVICESCKEYGIDVFAVTKVYCGDEHIAKASIKGGVRGLADSRLKNLEKFKQLNCEKLLLRIPMISQVDKVVETADISLNSELNVIKALNEAAVKINKEHKIILMIDLGDLREGIWHEDALEYVGDVIKLSNIQLIGIGTNLTCYGGIIPDDNNLGTLVEFKNKIEEKYKIDLPIVSGGNSSSLYKVLDGSILKDINMLRIGEAIVLGRETAYGEDIKDTYKDSFILKAEIVEIKEKPSVPIGKIGMDAFGNTPVFQDRGVIKRAIIAVGRQDVHVEGLTPLDEKIDVLGASSDHMILDVTNSDIQYKLGDIIEFTMDYGALLSSMTSEYVNKYYK